jgi:hypothetical protein
MNLKSLICTLAAVVVLSAWGAVPHLAAQASPLTPPTGQDGRISITLVLTESGGTPTLLRRAGSEPRNIILLDAATVDVQQLSDAVFHLLIVEAQDPQGQRRGDNVAQRVRVSTPHPVYSWADEALQRLRGAAPQTVAGVGAGRQHRAVQIWAAPLRGRPR